MGRREEFFYRKKFCLACSILIRISQSEFTSLLYPGTQVLGKAIYIQIFADEIEYKRVIQSFTNYVLFYLSFKQFSLVQLENAICSFSMIFERPISVPAVSSISLPYLMLYMLALFTLILSKESSNTNINKNYGGQYKSLRQPFADFYFRDGISCSICFKQYIGVFSYSIFGGRYQIESVEGKLLVMNID